MPYGDPLFRLASGTTRAAMSTQIAEGRSPLGHRVQAQFPNQMDKQQHALASFLIAKRMGVPISKLLGQGQEIVTGVMSAMEGKGFFGPSGYDPEDIAANAIGIEAAMEKWSKSQPTRQTATRR